MKKWILFLFISMPAFAATPKTVITKVAKKTELFDVLSYPARVESKVNATIYSDADGVVTKILKPIGESVKRNTKVMVIEHTDPLYQYAPLAVTSPVAGVVGQVKVTVGSRVTRGEQLASVTDPNQLQLSIEVASLDLPIFKKTLTGELSVPGRAKPIEVRVARLSPYADPATGTATCELEFVDTKERLPPGFVGHVNFKVNPREAIVLPEYAIFYRGQDSYVRVVQSGKSKKIPVTLGRRQRGDVEIISGLKANDIIIERASGWLNDGDDVKVETEGQKTGG